MKRAILGLGLLILWAAQARADSVSAWDVSGSFVFGSVAGGGFEVAVFSFTVTDGSFCTCEPYMPSLHFYPHITNSVMYAAGILGPLTPFGSEQDMYDGPADPTTGTGPIVFLGYVPTFSADGVEIDLQLAQFSVDGQPYSGGAYLWTCGSNTQCLNEFSPSGQNLAINLGADLLQLNMTPVTTADEPGALSLLCVGLLLASAAPVRRRCISASQY